MLMNRFSFSLWPLFTLWFSMLRPLLSFLCVIAIEIGKKQGLVALVFLSL